MIRVSVLVWTIILALLGVGLFQVKYNVQSKERELRDVRRQIEANLTSIHVLEAEWSYLNDPLRLADLARRHTDLLPTTPNQIGDIATLPPRQVDQPLTPPELAPDQTVPDAATPPLLSSATPQDIAPEDPLPQPKPAARQPVVQAPAAPIVPVKAEAAEAVPTPVAQPAEPKPLKPKDEQAEADAMIDAILADMEKAQGAPAGGVQ
jgi:hypothetical protein